jgi:hypothetical protein
MAKPRKVEEPAGTYSNPKKRTKKSSAPTSVPAGKSGVRYLDEKTASRIADKIFAERKDLLRRLAQ